MATIIIEGLSHQLATVINVVAALAHSKAMKANWETSAGNS